VILLHPVKIKPYQIPFNAHRAGIAAPVARLAQSLTRIPLSDNVAKLDVDMTKIYSLG
jgi:hypothetical protein